MMGNLYTYVMQHDAGLAPNPFWGWCTLAVCTPNHQGSRARRGDWIAGVSDKRRGYRLIHVMEVEERMHMNDYFRDPRFVDKKPLMTGSPQRRCGDNFYSLDNRGRWIQHPNRYHEGPRILEQDTRHPWVFISQRFWYLGRDSQEVPLQFRSMFGGRGARVNHPPDLVVGFKEWVTDTLREGVNALPRDLEAGSREQEAIRSACGSSPAIGWSGCGGLWSAPGADQSSCGR
jgi:hypothetical protein